MPSGRSVTCSAALIFGAAGLVLAPGVAEARCYTFQESHNGTDLFNPGGGAQEAARIKLMESIDQWRQKNRLRAPRVGKISYKCDPWNADYILPHHRCYAKARACF